MKQWLCLVVTALLAAALCGAGRADDEREKKPRFKGVELYSWKDKGGAWHYALLNGTNDIKTEEQVKLAKSRVKGTQELKKALARLAVGEHVSWTHRIKGFAFPPQATQKEIEKAARQAQIDLRIAP
jgi:hypothetical protein